MEKPTITITYCAGCRWMLRAAWMAQELLSTFEEELGGVCLRIGTGGIFEVHAGDHLIFSRKDEGGFIEIKELKQRVRDAVAPGKSLGHADRPAT